MKKTGIVIASIIALVLIISITCIFDYYSNRNKTRNEVRKTLNKDSKNCVPFTGGSFNLIFDTDGGDEIPTMSICIACSPDSYQDIPIPTKDGFKFIGWFTDKDYTNSVSFTNTKEFQSIPKYDDNNCMIGYEDITIYAKWDEIQLKEDSSAPVPMEEPPASENVVPPPQASTKIYKPFSPGYVNYNYGYYSGGGYNGYHSGIGLKIIGGDRSLYPINNGTVICTKPYANKTYRYILYYTNIDGDDYYVLYYTYFNLQLAKDFSNDDIRFNNVNYDEAIATVTYNTDVYAAVPGIVNVAISPMFMGPNCSVAIKMMQGNSTIPRVNPGLMFNINAGESFYER